MKFKFCADCGCMKNEQEFYLKNNGKRDTYCKKHTIHRNKIYRRNLDQVIARKSRYETQKSEDPLLTACRSMRCSQNAKNRSLGVADVDYSAGELKTWFSNRSQRCEICNLDAHAIMVMKEQIFRFSGYDKILSCYKITKLHHRSRRLEVDRINPEIGYRLNNIQLVCRFCNARKGRNEDMELDWVRDRTLALRARLSELVKTMPEKFAN